MSKLVLVFCFCAVALLAFVAPSPDGKFEACSDIAETLPLAPPSNGTGYHQIEAAIDDLAFDALDKKKIPGMTVAVTKGGRLVFNKAYGYSNFEKKTPMQTYHRTKIGSVTKIITTLGVMKLTEEYPDFNVDKKLYGTQGVLSHPSYVKAYKRGEKRHRPILAMAMDENNKVYTWYANQMVSVGQSKDLDVHSSLKPFTLPPGRTINHIRAIAISPNSGRVFVWYDNGSLSCGDEQDLDKYFYEKEPFINSKGDTVGYNLPRGKWLDQIIGIGMGKEGTKTITYAWYDDGTVSKGDARNLNKISKNNLDKFTVAPGKSRYDIRGVAVNNNNRAFAWLSDGTVVSGSYTDLDKDRAPYAYSFPSVPETTYGPPGDMSDGYASTVVSHLLSHTSGLRNNGSPHARAMAELEGENEQVSNQQAYFLSTQKLLFQPGTSKSYSNRGLGLCSEIIEQVSGKRYDQYISQKIFQPLGITQVTPIESPFDETYDSYLHSLNNDKEIIKIGWKTKSDAATKVSAAGGWSTTARNLARIMVATDQLPNYPDLLKPATLDLMETKPFPGVSPHTLGWVSSKNKKGHTKLSHNGKITGGTAFIAKYPDGYIAKSGIDLSNINIAICTNNGDASTDALSALATEIAKVVGQKTIPEHYDLFLTNVYDVAISTDEKFTGVFLEKEKPSMLRVCETWGKFTDVWSAYGKKGYRLIKVDVNKADGKYYYSGIWEQGSGKHALFKFDNWEDFTKKWKDLGNEGYRLKDVEHFYTAGKHYYVGVWGQGNGKHALFQYNSWDDFTKKWKELGDDRYRLIDIEAFDSGDQTTYIGVWGSGNDRYALYQYFSWDDFTRKGKELADSNHRLIDFELVRSNGQTRYLGVWRAGSQSHAFWSNVSWKSLLEKQEAWAKNGIYLVDFEIH